MMIKINKRPLTTKSMPPTGDEHAQLKTWAHNFERKEERKSWKKNTARNSALADPPLGTGLGSPSLVEAVHSNQIVVKSNNK